MDQRQTGGELERLTYRYDELSGDAKSSALQALHERYAPDYGWWEFVYQSIGEFCSELGGIEMKGFDSDGGWVCWQGYFKFTNEALESMAQNFGGEDAQEIIQYMQETLALYKLSRNALNLEGEDLWADYTPSYRRQAVVTENSVFVYSNGAPLCDELSARLDKVRDDLSDMMLKWLGDEYEYITSDEYVIETADVNDIVFDEEGVIVEC